VPEGTLLANLWQTQTELFGLPWQQFADSSGAIDAWLSGPRSACLGVAVARRHNRS